MNKEDLRAHFTHNLSDTDPGLWNALQGELARQQDQVELIASENLVSQAVLQAQGSVMTNKTVEGYPGGRYYGGAEFADQVESLAIDRACKLFGCKHANVQPHSGSNANQAVYLACLRPGDTILSMNIAAGGHISHGHPATLTGRVYDIVFYGLRRDDEIIDYDSVLMLAKKHQPKLIIAGGSAYSRTIDFSRLGNIARETGATFLVDMAHFAGLVATGLYPNPFPHADVVTTTTYKSLRGARGGMVLWNDDSLSKKINNSVFPGIQGSVLLHGVAGKAACLGEAATDAFSSYNHAVLENSRILADTLSQRDVRVVSGGTDCGLMLVDLQSRAITGAQAVDHLEKAGLTCNKNMIPFDPQPAEIASGLRLSVNTGTARGFSGAEFQHIGQWIADVLDDLANNNKPSEIVPSVREEIRTLCAQYAIYQ